MHINFHVRMKALKSAFANIIESIHAQWNDIKFVARFNINVWSKISGSIRGGKYFRAFSFHEQAKR